MSQPTDDKPSIIGAWTGHVTSLKNFGAPIVSVERLNLKSSKFVHRYINSNNRMTHQPQKMRGCGHVTAFTLAALAMCGC